MRSLSSSSVGSPPCRVEASAGRSSRQPYASRSINFSNRFAARSTTSRQPVDLETANIVWFQTYITFPQIVSRKIFGSRRQNNKNLQLSGGAAVAGVGGPAGDANVLQYVDDEGDRVAVSLDAESCPRPSPWPRATNARACASTCTMKAVPQRCALRRPQQQQPVRLLVRASHGREPRTHSPSRVRTPQGPQADAAGDAAEAAGLEAEKAGRVCAEMAYQLRGSQQDYDRTMAAPTATRPVVWQSINNEVQGDGARRGRRRRPAPHRGRRRLALPAGSRSCSAPWPAPWPRRSASLLSMRRSASSTTATPTPPPPPPWCQAGKAGKEGPSAHRVRRVRLVLGP